MVGVVLGEQVDQTQDFPLKHEWLPLAAATEVTLDHVTLGSTALVQVAHHFGAVGAVDVDIEDCHHAVQ